MHNEATAPTHTATLNGETIEFNEAEYATAVAALVEKHGGGVPDIKKLTAEAPTPAPAKPALTLVTNTPAPTNRERAEADEALATKNGFVVAEPWYEIGTAVNAEGVKNAAASQLDHESKPSAQDVCNNLVRLVTAEERSDLPNVKLSQTRMTNDGDIVFAKGLPMEGAKLPITPRMFNGLMGRFPCASGAAYLSDCSARLRAINYNNWAVAVEGTGDDREVKFRTRKTEGTRVGYAAVGPKYTAFDADKIGKALSMAFPSDAKGSLHYNGNSMRVEGLWHTDIKATDFVAGEIFKAGVIVRSDDTGSGSIRVQSVIWRNLCLNLIILDKAIGVDVRIRHVGDVEELAARFRAAFNDALTSVNPFREAWTRAAAERDRELIKQVQGTTRDDLTGMPVSAVLPGIFNAILKRDMVEVPGRADKVVPKLLEMHSQDEAAKEYGVSRASVVNAFTRYAHQIETDPFKADVIREGAGKLLSGHNGRRPAPLPYRAFAG